MSADSLSHLPQGSALFDKLADDLSTQGYALVPAALPADVSNALFIRVTALDGEDFQRAGVGRQGDFAVNPFVRSDEIRWLGGIEPAEAAYLDWMATLRCELNARLFLGLFDYEAHFARYQTGAFYKKHIDAFKGRGNRVLSTVFYLNPGWQAADGGQSLIYNDDDRVAARVTPLMGSLVVFLSERVPHEVLPAQRTRYSIAGWFRVNGSAKHWVDPPR